jgi:hypothetical protein
LLVELLAQAGEFVRIAEILGVHLLVECAGIGVVVGFRIGVGTIAPRLRAGGLVVAFGLGGCFLLGLAGFVGGAVAVHRFGAGGQHLLLLGLFLAFGFGGVVLRAGLFALLLLFVLLRFLFDLGFGFREIEGREKTPGGVCEAGLIVLALRHFLQRLLCFRGEIVLPVLQDASGGFRRLGAAHALPRQQRKCRGGRQLVLARHAVVAFGFAGLREPGQQIGGHTIHVAGAKNLDARLFERIVYRAAITFGGQAARMHSVVVVTQAKGQAVGGAAQPGHFRLRQGARGHRQAGAFAGQAGGAGLKGNLNVARLRQRADCARGCTLEFFRLCAVLGGHAQTAGRAFRR